MTNPAPAPDLFASVPVRPDEGEVVTTRAGGVLSADAIVEGLDPEQRHVALHHHGALRVLAGAGTGKTRAITHRIAYGVAAGLMVPQQVLAVTFSARAAAEMRHRLRGLGVVGAQARTFHSAALRQLHYFWPSAVGGPPPELVPHKIRLVAEAFSRLRLLGDRAQLRDAAAEVEWSKVSMLTADSYEAGATAAGRVAPGLDFTAMARVIEAYEEVKTERGLIDFEDVLLLTVAILAERDDIRAQVHQQYRHFVVDEYQDVNQVQQRLLRLWLGDRTDVCVVGDPSQTIYSFTGASAQHLMNFETVFPGSHTVTLMRNYRSSPAIVGAANAVLRSGPERTRAAAVVLQSQQPPGPRPTLLTCPDEEAEAEAVAAEVVRRRRQGVLASQIAVLFRTNAQSEAIERALGAVDIPYLVRGGERFFSRDEVKKAIVLLRGAVRADDGVTPVVELVGDVLTGLGWAPTPPEGSGQRREVWESLRALVRVAEDVVAHQPEARLREVVGELLNRAEAQHVPDVEGVTLASLHAAKGLEWDVVFLLGCSDGYLPIAMAAGPDQVEEERRLFYVGITRARRELVLSWASARSPGGRATRSRTVSRFVTAIAGLIDGAEAATPPRVEPGAPPKTVRRCRTCGEILGDSAARKLGRCVTCPSTYDEAMWERLKEWRLSVARRDSVPAFVVFTDATLMAIAELQPTSVGQLLTVKGVGQRKAELYGQAVVDVVSGSSLVSAE